MGEQDALGLANELRPTDVTGAKIGRKYSGYDTMSYVEIPVRFINGAEILKEANLVIDQSRIDAAMQIVYDAEIAATVLDPEDPGYPVKGDASTAWETAVTQIEGGATAQQVLDGLKTKAWGKKMLVACYKG